VQVISLPQPAPLWGTSLLVAALSLAAAGCGKEITCTSEITEGAGSFTAAAIGKKPPRDLTREATRAACEKLCAARAVKKEGCVSRCAVDAEVGKIGARTTCSEGGR
jgi:hypothetical protein